MICPKCGFEQPDSPECARCGIIVSRYKGPVLGAGAPHPAAPAPPPPVAASAMGAVFGAPAPAMAGGGGGGVYGDPPPPAGGGTVYTGPAPGSAAAAAMARPGTFAAPQGSLGIGDVLGKTFSVFFSNLLPFTLLTGITMAPLLILEGYTAEMGKTPGTPTPQMLVPLLLFALFSILCPYLATGAITYGVFQQLRGKDATIGDCLGRGLSALLPVLGLALVQGFAVAFGLVFCLIPGLLLAVRWAVSVPAMVTERTGVGESMSRSTFLTEGSRWQVFCVLFVLAVLQFGSGFVVGLLTAKNPNLRLTLSALESLFTVGLSATGSAVMYYRLRSLRESIDVDQIASVFD
jgi:hypothetical protein